MDHDGQKRILDSLHGRLVKFVGSITWYDSPEWVDPNPDEETLAWVVPAPDPSPTAKVSLRGESYTISQRESFSRSRILSGSFLIGGEIRHVWVDVADLRVVEEEV